LTSSLSMLIICADVLSPTRCAEAVVAELVATPDYDRQLLKKLIRQLIRDQYEHCAQVAEDWVANNDRDESLDGIQVGDGIAEALRQIADERVRDL
jgi:hypothetical protein